MNKVWRDVAAVRDDHISSNLSSLGIVSSIYRSLVLSISVQMSQDPVFLILKPTVGWLAEKEWTELLGAAVPNPWQPTNAYAPKAVSRYIREPLVELEFDGVTIQNERRSGRTFEAEMKDIGKIRGGASVGHELDLTGKKIYLKRLRQHPAFWKKLTTESDDFQTLVPEWVNEKRFGRRKHQVCLIVGLLLCQDVEIDYSETAERGHEFGASVPIGTAVELTAASHGVPNPTNGAGDTSITFSRTTAGRTRFGARNTAKSIFALQLLIISYKKDKLVLTDKTPALNRQLGAGDDDEELEIDDLAVLDDADASEWEALVASEEHEEP